MSLAELFLLALKQIETILDSSFRDPHTTGHETYWLMFL